MKQIFKTIALGAILALVTSLAFENYGLKFVMHTSNNDADFDVQDVKNTPFPEPVVTSTEAPDILQKKDIDRVAIEKREAAEAHEYRNAVQVPKQWVDRALAEDFEKTLNDASTTPLFVDGRLRGFEISNIRPGSMYQRVGLRNGDIVEAVNGIRLTNAAQAIQTLNALRNRRHLVVQINRGGNVYGLKIKIK